MSRHDAIVCLEGRLVVSQMGAAVDQDAMILQPVHHWMALRAEGVAPFVEPWQIEEQMKEMLPFNMPRPQAALTLAKLRSIAKADAPGRRQCPHMQPPPGPRMPCITTQDARRSADQCLGKLLESNNMQGAESRGELLLATLTKGNYMVLQIIIPKNDHHETCGSKYNITIYAYIYIYISRDLPSKNLRCQAFALTITL